MKYGIFINLDTKQPTFSHFYKLDLYACQNLNSSKLKQTLQNKFINAIPKCETQPTCKYNYFKDQYRDIFDFNWNKIN